MSSVSCIERLMNALTAYAQARLPSLLVAANEGQAIQAPAFKKIEKTFAINVQYLPMVAINFDSAQFEDESTTSVLEKATVDVYVWAKSTKPEELEVYLERYLDAVIDLGGYEASAALEGYGLTISAADKGAEGDGTRGWVVVTFIVRAEANL
jgi:hypothetical protein